MSAEHARSTAVRRQGAERLDERVLRRGDERGLVRRHTGRQQRLPRAPIIVGARRQEVDAAEPIDLDVDEAGRGDAAAADSVAQADLGDHAVLDRDVARNELAADERCADTEPHVELPRA